MQVIGHIEVPSGGVASVTFMSVGDIPSDYTDLLLVGSARTNRSSGANEDSLVITFNGSTAGFSVRALYGTGSSVGASAFTTGGAIRFVGATDLATANTFGNSQLYIANYRSSVAKSFSIEGLSENNATEAWQFIASGYWTGTDPITSITLDALVGSLIKEFSSFTLYGITAGSDGIVAVS